MFTLEEDFPELLTGQKTAQVFKLGEEPPVWRDHAHQTHAERWRNAEILRRMMYDYDPDCETIPKSIPRTFGRAH